jgi:hypothetical protein
MSLVGQSRPKRAIRAMSGLPPIMTELRTSPEVRSVPIPDSCAAASNPLFDHFIGECEGHSWNCEAERFGSVEVDD